METGKIVTQIGQLARLVADIYTKESHTCMGRKSKIFPGLPRLFDLDEKNQKGIQGHTLPALWIHLWTPHFSDCVCQRQVHHSPRGLIQRLTRWRWVQRIDVGLDIRKERGLHILPRRHIWRDVTSWCHWRGGITR